MSYKYNLMMKTKYSQMNKLKEQIKKYIFESDILNKIDHKDLNVTEKEAVFAEKKFFDFRKLVKTDQFWTLNELNNEEKSLSSNNILRLFQFFAFTQKTFFIDKEFIKFLDVKIKEYKNKYKDYDNFKRNDLDLMNLLIYSVESYNHLDSKYQNNSSLIKHYIKLHNDAVFYLSKNENNLQSIFVNNKEHTILKDSILEQIFNQNPFNIDFLDDISQDYILNKYFDSSFNKLNTNFDSNKAMDKQKIEFMFDLEHMLRNKAHTYNKKLINEIDNVVIPENKPEVIFTKSETPKKNHVIEHDKKVVKHDFNKDLNSAIENSLKD